MTPRKQKQRPRLGLVLGSGGARGWAHVGVLSVLLERGVTIDCVAGTSMGALVGAAFCTGGHDTLQSVALDLDWKRVLRYFLEFNLPRMGLIDGAKIETWLTEHIEPAEIENLPIPFAAVATDIETGKEIVLRKGNLIEAVRASIAIPGIFTPVVRDDLVLVDGGLVNPLPVSVARDFQAEIVVAVDITRNPLKRERKAPPPVSEDSRQEHKHAPTGDTEPSVLDKLNAKLRQLDLAASFPAVHKWFAGSELPNIFDIAANSVRIIERQITQMRLRSEPPDILIQPQIQGIGTMEFHRTREAIDAGRRAAVDKLRDPAVCRQLGLKP